jgi:hypothetical protein
MIQMKSCVLGCICLCVVPMHAQQNARVLNRRFSVKDSIEMTTFSDPYTRNPSETCKRSPDDKHFLVITTRGLLRSNRLESSLWIFSKGEVERYLKRTSSAKPRPRLLLRVAEIPKAPQSNSYGSLITAARWSSNSKSILTLVENGDGHRHIVRITLFGRKPVDLTPGDDTDVEGFSEGKGTIAYLVRTPAALRQRRSTTASGKPSAVLTGSTLSHILLPKIYPEASFFSDPLVLWVRYKGRTWKLMTGPNRYFPAAAALVLRMAVSPDGRSLIAARPVPDIPASWSAYQTASTAARFEPPHAHEDRSGKDFTWPWEYSYIDLDTRSSRSLVGAPSDYTAGYGDAFQAAWSQSGHRVLFTSSYLPLGKNGSTNAPASVQPCVAGVYDIAGGTVSCLAYPENGQYLLSASFGDSEGEIALRWLRDAATTSDAYEYERGEWIRKTADREIDASPGMTLSLHQKIDEPASLWASDSRRNLSRLLWNPNPQLASIALGQAKVYHWRDRSGYGWSGGLVLPPDYVSGRRYPLVLQTHGFYNHNEFLVDGAFTTGFAAQALAAAGIVVLQVEDRADRHSLPGSEEALAAAMGFGAAIDQLTKDGLADPSRIGIIGFSRTHWYVEEALIHDSHRYRAATLIDGVDQSYVTDILFAPNNPVSASEQEAANGGKPFGSNLSNWLGTAAGFNLDKVRAAVRIESIGLLSILGEWETYSSLEQQGKAVDFVSIPDGQHILQKPQERFVSQQGNVDWFRFWLQGYVDPDPAKWRQYQRWVELEQRTSPIEGHATGFQ